MQFCVTLAQQSQSLHTQASRRSSCCKEGASSFRLHHRSASQMKQVSVWSRGHAVRRHAVCLDNIFCHSVDVDRLGTSSYQFGGITYDSQGLLQLQGFGQACGCG